MAFTEAQRAQIREYLGYTDGFLQIRTDLEQAMNRIEERADTKTRVEGLLAALASIDTSLTSAYSRLKAAQVGAITLPGLTELAGLRSEGRRLVGRLASTFGVPVLNDAYGSSSAPANNQMREG